MYWSDLGSFDALNDYLKRIKYVNENIIENKSKDNFVLSEVKGKIVGMI
jgi:mannose-1-phosphate guanylyltransferase